MSKRNIYQTVGRLSPSKSAFDLSYEKKLTCDMAQLIPVQCDEAIPGDYWQIGGQALVRMQPLVAPVMHEINLYTHTFFVPYRILDEDWETIITGGDDGTDTTPIPEWEPTTYDAGSLWDYLGFPVDIDPELTRPIDYPRRAYARIYNEYYRDENLQSEVLETNEDILIRNWEKDYFTSALLEQQKGVSPAFPITGTAHALWQATDFIDATASEVALSVSGVANQPFLQTAGSDADARDNILDLFNKNVVDLSVASTFDIADIRLGFQIQKFMERNNRAGTRYCSFLRAHFDVSPTDDRLQRPEYIGGTKAPLVISEVLQTSSTDVTSAQGNMAGHGITATNNFAGKYKVKEFGLIMTIMSIMPRSAYQNGIDRQWLRRTRYDFPFPEFVNLSEQAIINAEICAIDGNTTDNEDIFGYQGRYDECRTKQSQVVSQMRDVFNYWHLGREFDPATPPELNSSFITCVPRKDIFAVPSEPGFIVNYGNIIKAIRPLPVQAEPGLIDHN